MIKEKRNFLRCWKARHFVERSNTWDFDCLAVQENLDSLLQYHNSEVSVLQCSAFSMVQFSHPFMTTGKTTALTIWTLISKVMSLLFNMLSMFITAFHPRSKCLLITWLQWFWSQRKLNLSLFPLFPLLFDQNHMGTTTNELLQRF